MENCGNGKTLSILMFPWLAHGHISPFLELAKRLVNRNFVVYLCSTPATLTSVRPKMSEKFSMSLKVVELHLPTLPDLPPQYHTTNGLPPHLMETLKKAFDMAMPEFCNILQTLKPDLLIYDFVQPWAPQAASALHVPAVEFITSSATMTSLMVHHHLTKGIDFPFSSTIYFRDYEIVRANKSLGFLEKRNQDRTNVFKCLERSSNIILIKSFKEIEDKYSDYITRLSGKKVVPVGPLVQDPSNDTDDSEITEWLNKKEKNSTVFVSFGSEYFLSKEDRDEIAKGLELSDVNFIWVLRFSKGENLKLEEALPKGFLKRVGERAKVVEGWAPQLKILSHPSIGGFVSHCGWGSVMEAMKFGNPIIALPMHIDQPINARLVEEVGVGVEVVRDGGGKLHAQKLATVINQVVKEESGEFIRKRARSLSDKIEVKGEQEIEEVVEELVRLCVKKNGVH